LLEVLVHLDVGRPLPRFVAFTFDVDAKLVETLAPGRLPRSWRTAQGMPLTQRLGDEWLATGRGLALAIPSTVVPEEQNYLLNPAHPAFAKLAVGAPAPFVLDARLAR
jgi:RES domain-containing protein